MFSYWEKDSFLSHQDFIIIGSGFVGLWTGIELKQQYPNCKVTILERGILPTGASTKNAGFSCFGSPTELINDAANYGEETMWNMVEKRYTGLRKIHNTFSYTSIDYQNCGGYECLMKKEAEQVLDNLEWLNKGLHRLTGVPNVFHFVNHQLEKFGLHQFDALIENKLEGSLQPAKLVQQLQQKAMGLGVQILTNIEVTQFTPSETIQIETTNNINFTCNRLIICTNAFTKKLLPKIDLEPHRGQVFITKPIKDLLLKGCFHYASGFYYFRNVGNRLLIGGARNKDFKNENTDTFDITETIQNELMHFVKKHIIPNTNFEMETSWSGIMAFGNEKKPIIQEVAKNIYSAVRMSGMGVAIAPMVAEDVVRLM